jgi:Ca2+-binding RTX toxin-like protein
MARLDVYEPLYMLDLTTWTGELLGATSTVISISDGFKYSDYFGSFKYKNGDIASGTVTGYNYWEGDVIQYSATELKLNAKTVQNLIYSGDSYGLMELAFKGNDRIDASLVVPRQDVLFDNELYGFNGNDLIYGSDGIDYIDGGNGNDKIYGYAGDDLILGMLGKDILTGGSGDDGFFFDTKLSSSNVDTITDFFSGEDTLFLDVSIFTKLPDTIHSNGNLADNLVIGSKALDSNDYLIFNPQTHTLSYDADGSGAGKAVAFVVLTGVNTIDVDYDIAAG